MMMRNTWFTSSYSTAQGNCVEVRASNGRILMRDSKNPAGGTLELEPEVFARFLREVKAGDYDPLD